jgi:hypothetical protein
MGETSWKRNLVARTEQIVSVLKPRFRRAPSASFSPVECEQAVPSNRPTKKPSGILYDRCETSNSCQSVESRTVNSFQGLRSLVNCRPGTQYGSGARPEIYLDRTPSGRPHGRCLGIIRSWSWWPARRGVASPCYEDSARNRWLLTFQSRAWGSAVGQRMLRGGDVLSL